MLKELLEGASSPTGCGKHDLLHQENQSFYSMGSWEVLRGTVGTVPLDLRRSRGGGSVTELVLHSSLTGMPDFLRGFAEGFTVSPAALRAAILDSMSET